MKINREEYLLLFNRLIEEYKDDSPFGNLGKIIYNDESAFLNYCYNAMSLIKNLTDVYVNDMFLIYDYKQAIKKPTHAWIEHIKNKISTLNPGSYYYEFGKLTLLVEIPSNKSLFKLKIGPLKSIIKLKTVNS